MRYRRIFVLAPFIFVFLLRIYLCGASDSQPGYWPTEGWRVSTPEEQGMDSQKLAEAIRYIKEKDPHVHSFLVIRNGYLVADAYFYPFTPDTMHDIASVTKSVTSTVLGVALMKKLIKNLDQTVIDFFPDREIANLDVRKKSVTIRDLLTMRSGLECINRPTELTLFRMMNSPDWIQYMLDLPMVAQPGTTFVYNSGGVHLLSAIIGKASGANALEFARANLFGPLGIEDIVWPEGPQGHNTGWGDIRMKPHDMAKIGYLYVNGGTWDGKRIVSADYVEEATRKPEEFMTAEYGYLWWIQPLGGYAARGRGGQFVLVDPDKNLIVVFTGGGSRVPFHVMRDFVRPAILSDGKRPANSKGVLLLQEKVCLASQAPPVKPSPEKFLPATAERISGKTFDLVPNPLGLLSLTWTTISRAEATLRLEMALDGDRSPEFKLGLDGMPRIIPARLGLPAAGKAKWTSEQTLVININEIGNINRFRITLTFMGDTVSGKVQEFTGLGTVTIAGKLTH